jgi:predicted RNA-binding protein (virulence factor B family)
MSDKYPEHEKLAAIKDKSQAIGEFLDFGLGKQGIILAQFDEETDQLWPTHRSITDILAAYFGIDQKKIDAEKAQMLDELRAAAG